MDDLLRQVASWWPWLATAVAILGGAWALGRVRREPIVDRADRAAALGLALALAGIASLGALAVAPRSNPVGGPIVLFLTLGVAIAVGGFVFLSALLGYVVLARPRLGAGAVAGIIVGPLVLGGTTALAMRINQDAAYAGYAAQRAEAEVERQQAQLELAGRSAVLHVSVRDVTVGTAPFHDVSTGRDLTVVAKVRLTLVIRADLPMRVRTDRGFAPEVWLYPGDDPAKAGLYAALPVTASDVLAAAEMPFELEFGYTAEQLAGRITYPPGEPGTWTLRVRLVPVDAKYLQVDTPLVLAAS